jgi:hypothetical protein
MVCARDDNTTLRLLFGFEQLIVLRQTGDLRAWVADGRCDLSRRLVLRCWSKLLTKKSAERRRDDFESALQLPRQQLHDLQPG